MTRLVSMSSMQFQFVCLLAVFGLNAPAQSLVIKHEPQLDTELYVAPATYTRKDGKALPSTIIISRPIGVRHEPPKKSSEKTPDDSLTFMSSVDDPKEGTLDLKHNIKFYKIECTSGRSCSSIIPAHTTTPPPLNLKPMSDDEIKEYLEQFSLRNGFQYSKDFEASGSPTIPEESESDESLDSGASEERSFGGNRFSHNSFWPGSNYRPRPMPSRAQVFKYQQVSRPTDQLHQEPSRVPSLNWDKISSDLPSRPGTNWKDKRPTNSRPYGPFPPDHTRRPSRPDKNSRPQSMLRPMNAEDDIILYPYGPPRPSPPPRSTTRPYDGVWNRYSLSTVSQLDRDTGEWVKISSSNTHLDQAPYSDSPNPSRPYRPPTHHASASLTVLGVNDRQPHSYTDSNEYNSHTVEVPSAVPGSPPETIETGGGFVHGLASAPLTVVQRPGSQQQHQPPAPKPSSATSGIAHVSVPLYLISTPPFTAAISDDPTTTTTSSTTTTTTTTTTARPPPITTKPTTTTTTVRPPSQANGGFFQNPSAVMAAVGAGLIPATFAALLPVFVGGRRRRRRRSAVLSDRREAAPEHQVAKVVERVWAAVRVFQDNSR